MAGMEFNFASQMHRQTLNRSALTKMIQEKYNQVMHTVKEATDSLRPKIEVVFDKEEELKILMSNYQFHTQNIINDFMTSKVEELHQKGFSIQEKLMSRIQDSEQTVSEFLDRLVLKESEIKKMMDRMKKEYADFILARKRWKSDFQNASKENKMHLQKVRDMVNGVENQNIVNTRAIKMMLYAQMIEQLVQRQETEDRKQLLVMASKTNKELMSTDGGVPAREINGPNINLKNLNTTDQTPNKVNHRIHKMNTSRQKFP